MKIAPYTSNDGVWKYFLREDGAAELVSCLDTDATTLALPDTLDGHPVTIRDDNPFYKCGALTGFTLSDDHPVFELRDGALFDKAEDRLICFPRAHAESVYQVPEGTRALCNGAFYSCGLREVELPDSVTAVSSWAFYKCAALEAVHLPETLTTIGSFAFSQCESLIEMRLPDALTEIEEAAFTDCASLSGFRVSERHPVFAASEGVLFDKTRGLLLVYPRGALRRDYKVPEGTRAIAEMAFSCCENLTRVTLPDSVTEIRDWAFCHCVNLREIRLSEHLISIGDGAFDKCSALTEIRFPDSLRSIGDLAFGHCGALKRVCIPEGVTTLGALVFQACHAIVEARFPASLSEIVGLSPLDRFDALERVIVPKGSYAAGVFEKTRLPVVYA